MYEQICIAVILAEITMLIIISVSDISHRRHIPEVRKLRIKLDQNARKPTRAHRWDAGYDLYAREDKVVPAWGNATFDTGVHVELPPMSAGILKSKSGLNVRRHLTGEGVIDPGYTGSIVVKLYNNSDIPYEVKAGDKIIQLLIVPVMLPELEVADALDPTERGDKGFGSSGRS